ncbi:MAG: hypothetical protein JWQ27_1044 [Ferruginibacter sp.]|nr:hypothetical protein [Ferruginibacter sp.]
MKNVFLILIAGLFSFSASAQKKKSKAVVKLNVPEMVDASFKTQYATVEKNKWSKNYSGNYEATFTNAESLKQVAEYNASGRVVKTKTVFDVNALPANISTAVQAGYPEAKVTECTKYEIPGVSPYYKVKVTTTANKNKDLFISEEGAITE